jgi:capsular exopolysaccharide synthesis family protein
MSKKNHKTDILDVKDLLLSYLKHWHWFLISCVVCGLIGIVLVKVKKPNYEVHANVLISQEDNNMLGNFGGLGDLFQSNGDVDDEIYVISSHTVYRDVAKELDLNKIHYTKDGLIGKTFRYRDYPVDVVVPAGVCDTLSKAIVFKVKVSEDGKADIKAKVSRDVVADIEDAELPAAVQTPYGKFIVMKTPDYPAGESVKTEITVSSYDAVAEGLAQVVLSELASKRSNVIELSLVTPDPKYGMDLLNEILKKYNDRGILEKNLQNQKTAAFIDERLAMISGDLNDAEASIQDYKQDEGITDVQAEAVYNTSKKSSAEAKLIEAQTNSEIIKMTRDFISDPTKAYEMIPAIGNIDGLSGTISSYNSLILRLLDLKANVKANAANIKRTEEQIDALRSTINTGLKRVYENSLVVIRDLQNELAKAQSKLNSIPSQERQYLNLKRQQEVKQQLYLFLLQRREETAMVLANSIPKGIIVDEAYTLSEPVGMGKITLLALIMIVALCIPPAILYLKKALRNKFDTRTEVENIVPVPILGEMTTSRSEQHLVVTSSNTGTTAELFRLLRTNLMFMLNDVNDKVIILTSTKSGEGKSFISINLAASMSLLGKKVCLVGMDIRKPKLVKYLDIENATGVTQYLATPSMSLDEIILHDVVAPNLDVIVAGPVPPNPGELLASQRVDAMFDQLRKNYDYVIVDTAPIGMVSDSFHLARIADATIVVTRANFTTIRDLDFLTSVYEGHRLPKMSLIVNGTIAKQGYGYGYKTKKQ